jgi:hypothetical protein
MFIKIDETLDEVYIPYYDYADNSLKKFKPDFIFWLKKDNNYWQLLNIFHLYFKISNFKKEG